MDNSSHTQVFSDLHDDYDEDEEEEESSALGLAEFDESGNAVSNTSTEAEQSSTGNPVIWWVIGGIIVVAIAGGCVWYFCFFRKGKNPFLKVREGAGNETQKNPIPCFSRCDGAIHYWLCQPAPGGNRQYKHCQ